MVSVALLLWATLPYSLGLCFVHSCFPSLSVCGKFVPGVRLVVVKGTWVYPVGKVLGKQHGGRSRHSLESGTTSNWADILISCWLLCPFINWFQIHSMKVYNWQCQTLQCYFKVSQSTKLKVESWYPKLSVLVLSYWTSFMSYKMVYFYIRKWLKSNVKNNLRRQMTNSLAVTTVKSNLKCL